jgi:hypothetical protein
MGTLITSYDIFCSHIPETSQRFGKLCQFNDDNGKIFLRGELDVIDNTGKFWESFEVEIHHVDGFPFKFPDVYEVGGKIPRIGDWHIYEDTHTCCITVPPDELIKCRNGIRLVNFVESEVLPYFFNQTHRRVEGYYVHGEYSHGYHGIIEFFDNELKTGGNIRKVISLISSIANIQKPDRTATCFCGSKSKFRKCHRQAYEKLILIGRDQLIAFASMLAKCTDNLDLIR